MSVLVRSKGARRVPHRTAGGNHTLAGLAFPHHTEVSRASVKGSVFA